MYWEGSTYLVSLADLTDDVLLGYLNIVECQLTSRRRSNTELKISAINPKILLGNCTDLLLLLCDFDTHILAHDETGDTLVPSRWVNVGEYLKCQHAIVQ